MRNIGGRLVTPIEGAKILGASEYFRTGYDSYVKKLPFDYNIANKQQAIYYARGRSFAIWCAHNRAPRATWRNGVAAKTVVERIVRAIQSQYVV